MRKILFLLIPYILFSNEGNIIIRKKDTIVETYMLQNINSEEVVSSLKDNFKVKLTKVGNQIVITGEKSEVKKIKELLYKLDKYKKQIYIKANIIETSSNLLDRLGFNWKLNTKSEEISLSKIFNLGGNFLGVDIDALKENGDIFVQSSPAIYILDGKEGELKFTEEIALSNGKEKPVFYEAGLILNLKPKIIYKGYKEYIQIEIYTEMSNFKINGKGKNKNALKTEFLVKNNSSIYIGTLEQKTTRNNTSKTPILGDIPIFGTLFRKKNNSFEKRDIYIEIEARIEE